MAILAVCISAGIFATTIHTQDFKDTEGDSKIGRQTIPIVYPKFARWTVITPMLAWSIGLSFVWELDIITGGIFSLLAVFIGLRYLFVKATIWDDQLSFYWYNVSTASHPED